MSSIKQALPEAAQIRPYLFLSPEASGAGLRKEPPLDATKSCGPRWQRERGKRCARKEQGLNFDPRVPEPFVKQDTEAKVSLLFP